MEFVRKIIAIIELKVACPLFPKYISTYLSLYSLFVFKFGKLHPFSNAKPILLSPITQGREDRMKMPMDCSGNTFQKVWSCMM